MTTRLLIVGSLGGTNVGDSLAHAARADGLDVRVCQRSEADRGPRAFRTIAWRLFRRRPLRLQSFSKDVVTVCNEFKPTVLLTTGIAPVTGLALDEIGKARITRLNYSTDDPWNPAHRAPWFLDALHRYDTVFTPRQSNVGDFRAAGVKRVEYLPFGYDPRFAYPLKVPPDPICPELLFVGGGDPDRLAILRPVIKAGIRVVIHGSYWRGDRLTSSAWHGQVPPTEICRATASAKVSLILVRRANRDGHVMRTFEAAACGGCLLVEDTADHRAIFGLDGECVRMFDTIPRLIEQTRWLLANDSERQRLASAVFKRIVIDSHNTYTDRLRTILSTVQAS